MLLLGRYKGARWKRFVIKPRTLEQIMEWNFGLPKNTLNFKSAEEKQNMANKNKPDDPFGDDWGMPASSSAGEMPQSTVGDKLPFIKPQHVGAIGSTGTLELVRVTGETSEYSDVILQVHFKAKAFRLGLRTFSAEYESLLKKFGKNPEDWHGSIRFKVLDNSGKPYVAVRA